MKPSNVVGLGVLAFGVGAALAPAVSPALGRAGASHFQASVSGSDSVSLTGRVAFGAAGRPGEPGSSYTITLGSDGGAGAIVFSRPDGATPGIGRHPIGEATVPDADGGFQALYIAGSAVDPRGVFRADSGTLQITSAADDRLSGQFELHATGFLSSSPDDETRRVAVSGAFTARRTRPMSP
jgi:hypothetical protein